MTKLGTETTPLRVAIIGAGPSAFYVLDALSKSGLNVEIDAFDRLPTPFGLLRGGVAPDHQRMKSVGKAYEKMAVSNPKFRFIGNVKIGKDISVAELKNHYDALVFACGAETDRKLGIPGEDLPGSHTATEFVGWYNGHPDYRDRVFNLNGKTAVVIGQGNVAIDVTRIMAKTDAELASSDIAAHAQAALKDSQIQDLYLVGRRGPVQSAFTELEIKEMGELSEAEPIVNPADFDLSEIDEAELQLETNHKARKNMGVLREFATHEPKGKKKRVHIQFYSSPKEITGNGKVEKIIFEKTKLVGAPGAQQAVGTGETIEIPCDIVLRSVGYRGIEIEGVPFEAKKGIFPNDEGRLKEGETPLYGMYAVGWIKRGPSGVLGSNKPCSTATVKTLLEDLDKITPAPHRDSSALIEKIKNKAIQTVSFEDWLEIDKQEIARGQAVGKPREKFVTAEALIAASKTVSKE